MDHRLPRKLTAILHADVVGYSRLMGEDEDGNYRKVREYLDLISDAITEHQGNVVNYAGDAVLADFSTVTGALSCATSIQIQLTDRNRVLPDTRKVQFRIGINLGEVIVDRDNIYGDGVNVAARLEAMADPGGICVSESVRTAAGKKLALRYEDLGMQQAKNISEPVHCYKVLLESGQAVTTSLIKSVSLELPEQASIAVLPFTNMSGDAEQEFFSDGISEDIITGLSKVSGLVVVARSSAFAYKGHIVKAQEISEDLAVRYLLEGGVRKANNRVRVTVQLIDGTSGTHVWAERYDRDLTDIFAIQDDIAQSIVEALEIAISPIDQRVVKRIPTTNLDAYEYYLRGRQYLHEMTEKNLKRAKQMFLKAIELDPEYAHAQAGVSDCSSVLALYYASGSEQLTILLDESRKALQLDPSLAEAHVSHALALSINGNDEDAMREFETAIQLDPSLYEAYWYFGLTFLLKVSEGGYKLNKRTFEQAVNLFERASQVRVGDLQSMMMLTLSYEGADRFSDAQINAEKTMRMVETRLKNNPDDSRAAYVGAMALVYLGKQSRALEWADISAAIESEDSRTNYNLTCLYSLLNEQEKAIKLLELSIKGGRSIRMKPWSLIDPDLNALRSHPRYNLLMRDWSDDR